MNKRVLLLVSMLFVLLVSGCYQWEEVSQNEIAVQMRGGKIVNVAEKTGGVYTDRDWYASLETLKVDAVTFPVEDPEVLTRDNQAVGVKITIQAVRKSDRASVENIFTRWNSIRDDQNLINTISATAREGMKVGTRNYTLSQLLDNRSGITNAEGNTAGLADDIQAALEEDVAKYSVEIINVTVENIAPSAQYMEILSQTANLTAQTEQEKRRQELINQQAANNILEQQKRVEVAEAQLLAEQAETSVQVELAERKGEVIAAQNAVYSLNPQAYELERLRLLKEVLGDKSVFYLPSDAILTLLQNFGSNVAPLPVAPVPQTTTP
jgi:hypothetical protein